MYSSMRVFYVYFLMSSPKCYMCRFFFILLFFNTNIILRSDKVTSHHSYFSRF